MGRATSVLLFCLAMDPLTVALNKVPSILALRAYMDDDGAAGAGLARPMPAFGQLAGGSRHTGRGTGACRRRCHPAGRPCCLQMCPA